MPPAEAAADTRRLFFALWPDAAARRALAGLLDGEAPQTGRRVPEDNLHLTLAFVGNVTTAQRTCMEAAAATVEAAPFTVSLERLGYWPRPRVVWAGATATPAALTELVARLNARLSGCGYEPERRPYQAHVTLSRKAQAAPRRRAIAPIVWPAEDFCLVESASGDAGSIYRVLARWPLRSAAATGACAAPPGTV
ncbi:MAG: RNA 2',3'-cyclic phosphodiesterase [Gammaproteobacteria bacterium]